VARVRAVAMPTGPAPTTTACCCRGAARASVAAMYPAIRRRQCDSSVMVPLSLFLCANMN
jgi:hypothetical protein